MRAKGNDATVTFDEGWLTIEHSGLGAIARGGTRPHRLHVRNIAAVELTQPRLAAGWFTVVPADRAFRATPVLPADRDPHTVRFSRRACGDFEAIRAAVLAAQEPQQHASTPHR